MNLPFRVNPVGDLFRKIIVASFHRQQGRTFKVLISSIRLSRIIGTTKITTIRFCVTFFRIGAITFPGFRGSRHFIFASLNVRFKVPILQTITMLEFILINETRFSHGTIFHTLRGWIVTFFVS